MGYYIDPEDKSKEQWLQENATACSRPEANEADFTRCFPVVLVDNGIFTAAGICYSRREYEAFTDPEDHRPKKFFVADRERLLPFCPALKE